jgi:hypothetical protein
VKDYCEFHNIPLDEKKYNGVVCLYIGGNNEPKDIWDELNEKALSL